MSYIIAHIVFDDNNLKSIDIIDEENGLTFETETLEKIINSGKKNFYYKINVDKCNTTDSNCFQLANSNSYKINFDSKNFVNPVDDNFLGIGNAESKVADSKVADSKVAESKVENLVSKFNQEIVNKLQNLVPQQKNTDAIKQGYDKLFFQIKEFLKKLSENNKNNQSKENENVLQSSLFNSSMYSGLDEGNSHGRDISQRDSDLITEANQTQNQTQNMKNN